MLTNRQWRFLPNNYTIRDFDFLAPEQSHFHQTLHEGIVAADQAGADPEKACGQPATGRTRILVPSSPRSDSRLPPICNRHGQPGWSNRRRQPVRSPSSARRPTQPGSPVTSATSAHSPGRKYSRGRRISNSTAPTPVTGKDGSSLLRLQLPIHRTTGKIQLVEPNGHPPSGSKR
jgi:hypothetical protein